MYQLQNIDYLYRISTMTGSSKLVTVQADRDSHDLNDKHFVMLNLCRAIVNYANEGHVISAVYELEPDGTSKRVAYRGLPEYQEALKDPEPDVIVAKFATNFSSGASFASQCRVNQKSREVFDIEASGTPSDNDDISERLVSLDDGEHWHQVHCPTLKRFSTNQKVLSVNGFGAAVPLFESPLVDTSYVDTVIADDIEDKEIEGLRKHLNPDGVISQLLNNVQKARAEKGIDEVESRVKQVETQIRLFLRTPEIENEIKDIETAHLNEEGSFDCGFIFWYPKADSQLEKDMSLLVGANRRKLSWLDIAVPTFSQSINVQRYGAELIKKLVKERLGIELYYRSELD